MKPKFLMLSGPSRAGKSAVTPLLSAFEGVDAPLNTPDLDWLHTLKEAGHLNAKGFNNFFMNYILCYSWYSYLGRHINLRPPDYYNFKHFSSVEDLHDRFSREDNDSEFHNFLKKLEAHLLIPVFHVDLEIEDEKSLIDSFPISLLRLHIRRAPIEFFKQWASGNRLEMGQKLSRRMQMFSLVEDCERPLLDQFTARANGNEMYRDASGVQRFRNISISSIENNFESGPIFEFVKSEFKKGQHFDKIGKSIKYETVVSSLQTGLDRLSSMLELPIIREKISDIEKIVQPRQLTEIMLVDKTSIEAEVEPLNLSVNQKNELIEMQHLYIDELRADRTL